MTSKIDSETLRTLLRYSRKTGLFTWLVTRGRFAKPGRIAGWINGNGYRVIEIFGQQYYTSRLAWFYVTGSWPTHEIDHKNRIRSDDRWANLREATRSQQRGNIRLPSTNKSGMRGVCRSRAPNKWIAQINENGRKIYLGTYQTKLAAYTAYRNAARAHYGEFYTGETRRVAR